MIYEKISDKELKPYLKGLKELDRFGVDFIVMICNTIHLYYDQLQEKIKTPILDLREELRNSLKRKGIRSTFILGTPNTIKKGLYKFDDIKYIEPNEKEVMELSNYIYNFNKGIKEQRVVQRIVEICRRYEADAIILGCTEFALILADEKIPKINTIDILVDATIRRIFDID